MTLAKKMFVNPGTTVRAVHLPDDVDLDDVVVTPDPESWDVTLWFVTDAAHLEAGLPELQQMWDTRDVFWLFYPKKPHLGTDLGRDRVFAMMAAHGMRGSRQVGIDDLWSCMYFKAK